MEENPSLIDLVPEVIFNAFAESAIEAGVSESLVDTLREELENGDNEAIASAFGAIIETGLLDFDTEMVLDNGLTASIVLNDDRLDVSFPLGLTVRSLSAEVSRIFFSDVEIFSPLSLHLVVQKYSNTP